MTSKDQKPAQRRSSGRRLAAPALILAAATTALLLAGSDAPAVDGMSTARATEAPLPPGPVPDLDLLFTAEVAGWVEPCG